MTVVAEKLEAKGTSTTLPKEWMKDWMKEWDLDNPTSIKQSSRHRCFLEVKSRAEEVLTKKQKAIRTLRDRFVTTGSSAVRWHRDLYKALCLPSAERLARFLKGLGCDYFVLAFDECSYSGIKKIVTDTTPVRKSGMSLLALRRVIAAGAEYDRHGVILWYLFLDTDSSMFNPTPSGPLTPSARPTNEVVPLPLWTYLGFDQMVSETHAKNIQKPADVLKLDHQKAYGRPVSIDTPCASFTYCHLSPVLVDPRGRCVNTLSIQGALSRS
jgi:hypothetical protein